jgi:citrate synthase
VPEEVRLFVPKRLEEVMAEALHVSPSAVNDTLAVNAIPQWDSLAHVELMIALEQAYGVSIDEDRMLELVSVRAIRDFLTQAGR